MTSRAGIRERVEAAVAAVRALPPRGALAREMRGVRRAEVFASTALSGSRLSMAEVDALLDAGIAQGNHPFDDYVLVRAYADAARWVADARGSGADGSGPILTVEDVRQLNARVTAGSGSRGGAWRQANFAPESGIVAPAAWLVAREMTVLVDRTARGPGAEPVALWIARFMGRLARVRPFEAANGRTMRLTANVLLRRLDYPPLVFEQRDRARYPAAVAAAENRDPSPLAALVATALIRVCNRLAAAADAEGPALLPLREAAAAEYTALAKAAQRGRLRTIVRGGRYFTTRRWIADYRAKNGAG